MPPFLHAYNILCIICLLYFCILSSLLECLKGFLLSKILQKMSEDVNTTAEDTSPKEKRSFPKSFSMSNFTAGATLHLSRTEMFNMLRDEALATLCR